MIRNTIFDIGGVLFDYNEKIYLDKLNIEESTGGLNKKRKKKFFSLFYEQLLFSVIQTFAFESIASVMEFNFV